MEKEEIDRICKKAMEEFKTWEKDENREVSDSELSKVLDIMGQTKEWLDKNKMEVFWTKGGKISVRTPLRTWMALCGREWHVDLENGTYKCVALS